MDLSPAHLHLVLNHIPVLGTMLFAPLVLVWGLLRRSRDVTQIGLLLAVLLAATTIPIYLTGEPAEEQRPEERDELHQQDRRDQDLCLEPELLLAVRRRRVESGRARDPARR